MQFKHVQEINAPIDYVFARMTDFTGFEQRSGRGEFSFSRVGRSPVQIGTKWNVCIPVRGRKRKFPAELSEYVAPSVVSYRSKSRTYNAVLSISFTPLSASICNMEMQIVAQSRSFATGMIFNTLRLARKRINKSVRDRMQVIADKIADDYRNSDS